MFHYFLKKEICVTHTLQWFLEARDTGSPLMFYNNMGHTAIKSDNVNIGITKNFRDQKFSYYHHNCNLLFS